MTTAFTAIPMKMTKSTMRLRGCAMSESYGVLADEFSKILSDNSPDVH